MAFGGPSFQKWVCIEELLACGWLRQTTCPLRLESVFPYGRLAQILYYMTSTEGPHDWVPGLLGAGRALEMEWL